MMTSLVSVLLLDTYFRISVLLTGHLARQYCNGFLQHTVTTLAYDLATMATMLLALSYSYSQAPITVFILQGCV